MLAAVCAAAVALRFGYERAGAYTDGCASTPTTRSLGRLALVSSGVSVAFAAAAAAALVRRTGTTTLWVITSVVLGAAMLVDVAALVGGGMCIGFPGGAPAPD